MAAAVDDLETLQSAQALVDALSIAIDRPVLLDDASLVPLAYSRHWGDIDGVRSTSLLGRAVRPEIRAALVAHGITGADDVIHIPANPTLEMSERVCLPVRASGQLLGFVWLLNPGGTLSDAHLQLAGRAARRAAALLSRSAPRQVADESSRLRKLTAESAADRNTAIADALSDGVLGDGPHTLCLVSGMADYVEPMDVAGQALRRLSPHHAIMGSLLDAAAVLASTDDPVLRPLRADEIAKWVHALAPGALAVGQSAPVALHRLPEALRHAAVALRVARTKPVSTSWAAWQALRSDRLVAQLPETWTEDVPPELGRVLREQPALASTLAAYLDAGGRVKDTAEATSLHRSGVYYRLRRFEELTGLHLDDGDDRLLVHMAVRARQLDRQRPPGGDAEQMF